MITRKDAAQCLLVLVGAEVSGAQKQKLISRGLLTVNGTLNNHGFVAAYEQLADIAFGGVGTNTNRQAIAEAANREAAEWKKVKQP